MKIVDNGVNKKNNKDRDDIHINKKNYPKKIIFVVQLLFFGLFIMMMLLFSFVCYNINTSSMEIMHGGGNWWRYYYETVDFFFVVLLLLCFIHFISVWLIWVSFEVDINFIILHIYQ